MDRKGFTPIDDENIIQLHQTVSCLPRSNQSPLSSQERCYKIISVLPATVTLIQICVQKPHLITIQNIILRRNTAGFQEVYAENKLKAKIKIKLKLHLTLSQAGCVVTN